jgi:uncharacterized heparinase superfamily protein
MSQLFYQVLFRVRAKVGRQTPSFSGQLTEIRCAWSKELSLLRPCGGNTLLRIETCEFRFVGLEHSFGSEIHWQTAGLGKLWDYNLHYFEWLWDLDPEAAKCITLDWIERHPFALNAVGWEPYPNSLRIMNWLGYWGTVERDALADDSDFRAKLFESIGLQCDWLTKRLEKHLLGNHYLENGAALWIAGTFFDHPAAENWKQIGLGILEQQLPEQLLADGMHFERSPMYHNRLVYLLEWFTAIEPAPGGLNFSECLERAKAAAGKLQHPDGHIALLNDSAFGIYPELAESSQEVGVFALPDAGYYGARSDRGDYIICDAGRIGPDYLPGHSHCDIGSFELSIEGERFITDTGVHNYENDTVRHATRSTLAHNTFSPKGMEQAEIWSAFRVGERPDVTVSEWNELPNAGFVLEVSHDGFARKGGSDLTNSRRIRYSGECSVEIEDSFSSSRSRTWQGRLHFAPSVQLVSHEGGQIKLSNHGRTVEISLENVSNYSIKKSNYYPRFNTAEERLCLQYEVSATTGMVEVKLNWGSSGSETL